MYSIIFTTMTIGMITIKIMLMMVMMIMWCLRFCHNNDTSGSDIGNDSLGSYDDDDDDKDDGITMKKMRIELYIWWRSDHSNDDSSNNHNDNDAGGATVNKDAHEEGCLWRHNQNFMFYLPAQIAKLSTRYSNSHPIQYKWVKVSKNVGDGKE